MPRPDATIDLMISMFSVSATTRGLMSARHEELVDDPSRVGAALEQDERLADEGAGATALPFDS